MYLTVSIPGVRFYHHQILVSVGCSIPSSLPSVQSSQSSRYQVIGTQKSRSQQWYWCFPAFRGHVWFCVAAWRKLHIIMWHHSNTGALCGCVFFLYIKISYVLLTKSNWSIHESIAMFWWGFASSMFYCKFWMTVFHFSRQDINVNKEHMG